MALPANSLLFREYIGTGGPGSGARFPSVPINEKVQFHFIVSSAIIDYNTASPPVTTNGKFTPYWDLSALSAERMASIKKNHSNVKVILSLGGDKVGNPYVKPVTFIVPSNVDVWANNAFDSLSGIIDEYKFDGIDINYMHFSEDAASPGIFAECIGGLLRRFKEANGTSFITSIAPSTDGRVQSHYTTLWGQAHGDIDYVNFKFYTYSPINNVDEFLRYFHDQSTKYNNGKVLASITTTDRWSPDHGFWDACDVLRRKKELHGIFIWSADLSRDRNDFDYERQAQALLANGNNTE